KNDNHSDDSKEGSSPRLRGVVKKRHDKQEQTAYGEPENAQDLAVERKNFRRNQLQRLEHEQEVPLRPDPGRGGCKRIGLLAQLPRKNRRKSGEHAYRQDPSNQIADEEPRNELHLTQGLSLEGSPHAHRVLMART